MHDHPQSDAQRQHKRRAREKSGIEVWATPVRANHVTALLMATEPPRLSEEAARDPRRVLAAFAKWVDDLAKIARSRRRK